MLPRSTDYPTIGYDILDGARNYLNDSGAGSVAFFTENIGFGEDDALNYAKAEKLLLQDDADLIVAYCNVTNAEPLYQLADALGKPFVFLDAGMLLPAAQPSLHCFHLSLQGIHACRLAGKMAGEGARKVLLATSFYDGGYRGPWSYDRGLSEAGGSVCGNYVSGYRIADFTIAPYIGLLQQSGADSVAACFSSYLAQLFFKELNERKAEATRLPFYCSPFMAEEQMLGTCDFPGGDFFAVVPWGSPLTGEEQERFKQAVRKDKNKEANIFHLLGWEAAIVAKQVMEGGLASLSNFTYASPRGTVTIHPQTHCTYAPLYSATITGNREGKCSLQITGTLPVSAEAHLAVFTDRPESAVSGWRNNYLCI